MTLLTVSTVNKIPFDSSLRCKQMVAQVSEGYFFYVLSIYLNLISLSLYTIRFNVQLLYIGL